MKTKVVKSMRSILFSALALTIGLVLAGPVHAELLSNPGFETPDSNGTAPLGWALSSSGAGSKWAVYQDACSPDLSHGMKLVDATAHTGTRFLELGVYGGVGYAIAQPSANSYCPAVIPAYTYALTCWVADAWPDPCNSGTNANAVTLKIEWLDSSYTLLSTSSQLVGVWKNGNWYQGGLSAAAPTGAAYARPVIGTTKVNANVKFDDVSLTLSGSPAIPATKALEWNLDTGSGTVAVDTSGNGNNGDINGAAWTSGLFGNALLFDDVNDQVTASGLSNMPTDANDSWSMNVYVYMDSSVYDVNHVAMRVCGFGTDAWGSDANYQDGNNMGHGRSIGENYGIAFLSDGMTDITTGVPYSVKQWQMITITYDALLAQNPIYVPLNIYKNGVKIGEGTPASIYYTGGLRTTEPIANLAQLHNLSDPNTENHGIRFAGKLDGFTIWNGVLTSAQRAALLTYMPEQPAAVKVLEWKLDGDANDSSGNSNNGTIVNKSESPYTEVSPQYVSGLSGQAIKFGYTDPCGELGYLSEDSIECNAVSNPVVLPTGGVDSWSMNAYVRVDFNMADITNLTAFNGTRIAGFGTDSWNAEGANDEDPCDPLKGFYMGHGRSIGVAVTSGVGAYISFFSEGVYPVVSTTVYDINTWQMVTVTYDADQIGIGGSPLKIYKNGALIASGDPTGTYYDGRLRPAEQVINVGKRPNPWGLSGSEQTGFMGLVEDFTIWNGVLSQKQIAQLLDSTVGDKVVLGDFDDSGHVTAIDLETFVADWLEVYPVNFMDSSTGPDFDGDGIVTFQDFALLAQNWLF